MAILVTRDILPEPSEWAGVAALPGGIWRTGNGIHVVWQAFRWLSDAGTPSVDKSRTWLAAATFDPTTGSASAVSTYDIYPPQVTSSQSGLYTVAGRSDGLFSVGYDWFENGSRPQRALFLKVSGSTPTSLELPVDGDPSQLGLQTHAAWDGKAFALHAYGAPPQFTLHVARVDPQGNVLLPFTQYGITKNTSSGAFGHKSSTNPISGRTYVFDADLSNRLSGHLQDGSPLPGTGPTSGPKVVEAIGLQTTETSRAAVSADADGAWVGWSQTNTTPTLKDLVFQRLDIDGNPEGAAIKTSITPLDDPGGIWRLAVLSRGKDRVFAVGASPTRVYGFLIENGVVGPASVIVDAEGSQNFDVRDLVAFDYEDETWIGFSEVAAEGAIRVLRVKPGCVYPSLSKASQ